VNAVWLLLASEMVTCSFRRKSENQKSHLSGGVIDVTLQLNVTIWVPIKVTQHVIEHEAAHRQISEYFYQTAGELAQRIAAPYVGKQVVIAGANLHGELSMLLQKMGADITDEYNKELNVERTQLRFDAITEHGRNEVGAKEAAARALSEFPPAMKLP
jgi:hypothetical protein